MNIATVAQDTVWKDFESNINALVGHVGHVMKARPNTDIILFPEVGLHGYVLDQTNKEIALGLNDVSRSISKIARDNNVAIVCGFIESNDKNKPLNTLLAVSGKGDLLASYSKNHLFTQSSEPDVYTAGESLSTFDLHGWKFGLSICFDIRFPRLYSAYKERGVECVLIANNWVAGRNKPKILEHLVKARAHENQYFVVAVDRSGKDPATSYHGISVISNPYAEDIAERDGIYSYASLSKEDIKQLREALPLSESFKPNYKFK